MEMETKRSLTLRIRINNAEKMLGEFGTHRAYRREEGQGKLPNRLV